MNPDPEDVFAEITIENPNAEPDGGTLNVNVGVDMEYAAFLGVNTLAVIGKGSTELSAFDTLVSAWANLYTAAAIIEQAVSKNQPALFTAEVKAALDANVTEKIAAERRLRVDDEVSGDPVEPWADDEDDWGLAG